MVKIDYPGRTNDLCVRLDNSKDDTAEITQSSVTYFLKFVMLKVPTTWRAHWENHGV